MATPRSIFADASETSVATAPAFSAMPASYQHDLSRSLLGLLRLAAFAHSNAQTHHPDDALQGVIVRPVLRMLLSALRRRDAMTLQHTRRVAVLAAGLARNLGWDRADQKVLEVACLLHDVGKIGIPDYILFKPGRLNAEEARLMSLQGRIGLSVLQACGVDLRVVEFIAQALILAEQEQLGQLVDTSGFQQGARILTVADAYDSLRTDQVYREGRPHEEILEILMSQSGTRFDSNVVCALARWIEQEGLPELLRTDSPLPPAESPGGETREMRGTDLVFETFSQLFLIEREYDGYFLLDGGHNVLVWSWGLEQLLGLSPRDVLRRRWSPELLGYTGELGQPLALHEIPMQQVLQGQPPQSGALRLQPAPEQAVAVEIHTLPLTEADGRFLGAAEIVKNLQRSQHLPPDYRELKLAASRDPLTAVANRGELETQLRLLFDDWQETDDAEPFSVIFLDIDFFKNINDTFGHTVGDQVLIDVARLLKQKSYSGELVGRYGGEEFVLLCPAVTLDQAVRRAERLRESIQSARIGSIGNYRVTASFGVAQVERSDSPESVLRRADFALYQAKESGRNKTCALTQAEMERLDRRKKNRAPAAAETGETEDDPFRFSASFSACLGAEMIVYKLQGLVTDEKARLCRVEPHRVEIQFGSAGLIPIWGGAPQRRPVRAVIEFEALNKAAPGRYAAAPNAEVKVTIRPVGVVRKAEVFRQRAREVLKLIRAFLQAV